jgi:tRNA 2-thiouridine synthesizing protein E
MALADLERDGHGYLVDLNQWDERIAAELAEEEGVNLTDESETN